ncbi:YjbQ family protein [Candidatus Daviesbacteria bacterium]|nr:YjbQ family protein [Candidatus Daviesbacteria bacterium]
MKAYLKEIKFPSIKHTYIQDITDQINEAIKKAKVEDGFVVVNTKHTTLGVLWNEIAEPNLLQDILRHTLLCVPEDKRSHRASNGWEHPTADYLHRCQDNPLCNEVDEDYNAGSHIRALTYSHPSVTVPVRNGKLELGKYQQVALFEFDGRDGSGKNPIRQRTAQIWIYPLEEIVELG